MPGPKGVITVNGNTERSLLTEEHALALAAKFHYEDGWQTPKSAIKARKVDKRVWFQFELPDSSAPQK